jgi:Sulfotransferase family
MNVNTQPTAAPMSYDASSVPNLIGIFGTGRNGSTLITRLLDGTSGAYVHPVESNFLSAINDLCVGEFVSDDVTKNVVTHPLRHLDRPVPIERLRRYYAYHQREIETDLLSAVDDIALGPPPFAALDARPEWLARDFVPAFLTAFARWLQSASRIDLLVFKTIETPYIADYERLFPSMRFIHIVRDPVDMWSSQKRSLVVGKNRPPWYLGMDNLSACIDRRWVPHARAIVRRMKSPGHFVLRYEDLLQDPQASMKRVHEWMGGRSGSAPTTQTVLGGRHPKRMQRFSSQPGVETPREVVSDLKQRHQYVDVMTERERNLIRLATWSLGHALNYGLDEKRPEPAEVRASWNSIDQSDGGGGGGMRVHILNAISFLKRRLYVRRVCREAGR